MNMPRKKVDMSKLPLWLQYLIAIVVAGFVFGLVYILEGDQASPSWIETYLTEQAHVTAARLLLLLIFILLVRKFTR